MIMAIALIRREDEIGASRLKNSLNILQMFDQIWLMFDTVATNDKVKFAFNDAQLALGMPCLAALWTNSS
jgi:hypothetical protein